MSLCLQPDNNCQLNHHQDVKGWCQQPDRKELGEATKNVCTVLACFLHIEREKLEQF